MAEKLLLNHNVMNRWKGFFFSFFLFLLHVAAVPYCCSTFPCSPENGFVEVCGTCFFVLGSVVT